MLRRLSSHHLGKNLPFPFRREKKNPEGPKFFFTKLLRQLHPSLASLRVSHLDSSYINLDVNHVYRAEV